MTHFDFKTLLPALLQVEDRVSMAHGLESRTPFVDHEVVEFAATLPALVKFQGRRAEALAQARARRPRAAVDPRAQGQDGLSRPADGMGARAAPRLSSSTRSQVRRRDYLEPGFSVERLVTQETSFGRSLWGLLSLELWQQSYHDRSSHWRELQRRMTAPDVFEPRVVGPGRAAANRLGGLGGTGLVAESLPRQHSACFAKPSYRTCSVRLRSPARGHVHGVRDRPRAPASEQ